MTTAVWGFSGTVTAALLALLAAVWIELRRARREATTSREAELRGAVVELLTRSVQLHSRVTQVRGHSNAHASIGGLADHILRAKVPMDWARLFEPLNTEMEHMMRANARLWVGHNEETARLADDVVAAAGRVIGAVTASSKSAQPRRMLQSRRSLGRKAEEDVGTCVQELTAARNALASHARKSLGLPTAIALHMSSPGPVRAESSDGGLQATGAARSAYTFSPSPAPRRRRRWTPRPPRPVGSLAPLRRSGR